MMMPPGVPSSRTYRVGYPLQYFPIKRNLTSAAAKYTYPLKSGSSSHKGVLVMHLLRTSEHKICPSKRITPGFSTRRHLIDISKVSASGARIAANCLRLKARLNKLLRSVGSPPQHDHNSFSRSTITAQLLVVGYSQTMLSTT